MFHKQGWRARNHNKEALQIGQHEIQIITAMATHYTACKMHAGSLFQKYTPYIVLITKKFGAESATIDYMIQGDTQSQRSVCTVFRSTREKISCNKNEQS